MRGLGADFGSDQSSFVAQLEKDDLHERNEHEPAQTTRGRVGSVPDSTLSCAEAAALGWVHRISVCGVMWMMPFATTFLPLYSGSLQTAARKCSAARYRRKEKE